MEFEKFPVMIFTLIIALIVLAVGIVAVLTVTEQDELKTSYDTDFTVSDTSIDQTLTTQTLLEDITVTQTLSNSTTLTVSSSDYDYATNKLVVDNECLWTLLQEYDNTGNTQNISAGGTTKIAQTFTVGTNGSDTGFDTDYLKVKVYRYSGYNPCNGNPGPVYFNITAVNNTAFKYPTGAALATGVYIMNQTSGVAGYQSLAEWENVNLTSYTLVSGTTYAIVMECANATAGNETNWTSIPTSTGYPGGKALTYDGANWVNSTTPSDFMFEVYAQNETSSITVVAHRDIPEMTGLSNQMFNIIGIVLMIGVIFIIVYLIRDRLKF